MIRDNDKNSGETPPYSSFKSFGRLIGQFRESPDNLPESIQSSVLRDFSGFDKSALIGTLRWFDLIDESRRPTDALRALVGASEKEYAEQLRRLVLASYDKVVNAEDLKTITAETLEKRFSENGRVSGTTMEKAVKFLVNACSEAGIEISRYISAPLDRRTKQKSRKTPQKRRAKQGRDKKPAEVSLIPASQGASDAVQSDMLEIQIPLPGQPSGKIVLPKSMSPADWRKAKKMIHSILDIYTESEDAPDLI
jgi:hypothetical protein